MRNSTLFHNLEIPPEEEEEIVKKAAELIHKYDMNAAAILMLESTKPLVFIGGQMGRFFLSPFLPVLGETVTEQGEKFFTVFEKRENVEKLIQMLEKMSRDEEAAKKEEKLKRQAEKAKTDKKGLRRIIPFK